MIKRNINHDHTHIKQNSLTPRLRSGFARRGLFEPEFNTHKQEERELSVDTPSALRSTVHIAPNISVIVVLSKKLKIVEKQTCVPVQILYIFIHNS